MTDSAAVVEPVASEVEVAAALAAQYGVAAIAKAAALPTPIDVSYDAVEGVRRFTFDAAYQSKIAALTLRDPGFHVQVGHLLRPEYFENAGEATLVNIALKYYEQYARLPDLVTQRMLVLDGLKAKTIRDSMKQMVFGALVASRKADIGDSEFAADKVAEFARHQAVELAILQSVNLLDRGDFAKIEKIMGEATVIGVNNDGEGGDYWASIAQRTEIRLEKAAGKTPPTGITTGVTAMNDRLYHRGWGRKELSVIMGGAKAGKSMGLLNFAKYASVAGFHVLYATLELSKEIAGDRLDAAMTDTMMTDLGKGIHDIRVKIEALGKKAGRLEIREFPSGTLSPQDLHAVINRYKAKGEKFDLVVVDYADIMRPNHRTDNAIENSKSIWIDLRAIAGKENLAMLTATQTNRDGYMATTAKAEHVADDFNKIRTADLVISINSTDDERKRNEARLHFAASRNQEGGFTLVVRQNRSMMKFIEAVIGIE